MALENKDQSKPTASGMESSLTGGGPSVSTGGSTTGGTSSTAQMRDSLKEGTAGMTASARQYAGDMASLAKEKSRTMFEQQKESALGQVSSVAGAIRNTAQNLQGEGQDQTARYVQMIADQLESLGGRLRQKDLDTLVRDAEGFARRSPGTFLVGSIAAGFLLARFLKSSSRQSAYGRDAYDDQRLIAAGEAGPYVGAATASPVGADGTPAAAGGVSVGNEATAGTTASGLAGSNIGGNQP